MNVLLIGGGGREHALAWKLKQSPLLDTLYCAPGNAGIAEVATCVALDAADHAAVIRFCKDKDIGLVVVGPEAPLVAGLADDLEADGITVFGPSKAAAQLEGSKGFTKDLCAEYGIPTASYGRFSEAAPAKAHVESHALPVVIKADGLAGEMLFDHDLGAGEEASFFALVDGKTALPLATAQDHKRAYDGDTGPNTGGMGAYSPAPIMTETLCAQVMDEIIMPTVAAMTARGTPFKGVLYAGLMIEDGRAKLIEYNVRFGDPEAQVLAMRLKSDLLPALIATAQGTLGGHCLDWHDDAALCVVMAAKGYPGDYKKGTEIKGLEAAGAEPDVEIFHAGTKRESDRVLANGGRVLGVTARGQDIRAAQTRAYQAVDKIDWRGGFCRRDIGWRAVAKASRA